MSLSAGALLVSRFAAHGAAPAIIDSQGVYTYKALVAAASSLSSALQAQRAPAPPVDRPPRIAFMCSRDNTYVQSQLAVWHSGAIAVPIAESHPPSEIEYVLRDCGACAVMSDGPKGATIGPLAAALNIPHIRVAPLAPCAARLADMLPRRGGGGDAPAPPHPGAGARGGEGALLVYTSGTTGRPKGVLTTHGGLLRQITALTEAWAWRASDHIYSVLPLHHVHGVVAILNSALWSGAVCELAPRFNAGDTLRALTRPPGSAAGNLSLFMAVPTVYAKLVEALEAMGPEARAAAQAALRASAPRMRLMVSGSAALPQSVAEGWAAASGFQLLERYGMTEFAMGVSNPYAGGPRKLNSVGKPLPGYAVRLAPEGGAGEAPPQGFLAAGEIQLKGEGVFSEYWGRPEATAETFTSDGWFKTGDMGAVDGDGYYFILGRLSADIIKSGGFKISALDIEREMLTHPEVGEVAVLGLPDAVYGEKVAAVLAPKGESEEAVAAAAARLNQPDAAAAFLNGMKAFLKDKLPPYKIPSGALRCPRTSPLRSPSHTHAYRYRSAENRARHPPQRNGEGWEKGAEERNVARRGGACHPRVATRGRHSGHPFVAT
jgi:malonyl-CoA/methylmalonyl-CoA synthetase